MSNVAKRPTTLDLIDRNGLFKLPETLPRRVRLELVRYRVSPDRRGASFRFRKPGKYPRSPKRKARRATRLTKVQLETLRRLLNEEIAQLRAANQGGA